MDKNFHEMPPELVAKGWGQESLLPDYECTDTYCDHCGDAVAYHRATLGEGGVNGCIKCHPENFIPGWREWYWWR